MVVCVRIPVCIKRGGGGHRIPLLGNISVRTALLHHHPASTHTHTHPPSAPVQGSSVAVAHMWPEYSKQRFIKSSTKTGWCDSQSTNDAWRPLNTPLTDQQPACHTHTHITHKFSFWHAATNFCNHYGRMEHMLTVANTQIHTNPYKHTHTPCAQGHLSAA